MGLIHVHLLWILRCLTYALYTDSRRSQASGAGAAGSQSDQSGMLSRTKDPTADVSGRQAGKGPRGDGKGAQTIPADMMSMIRQDPEADVLDFGVQGGGVLVRMQQLGLWVHICSKVGRARWEARKSIGWGRGGV